MIPTRRLWWLLALGIPIAGIASQLSIPFYAIAYDLFLLAVAWGTTRLAPSAADLVIQRKFDPVLSAHTENTILLSIKNEGSNRFQALVRDEPPATFTASNQEFRIDLLPGAVTDLCYQVTPPERGSESFRATFLRIECPLGLALRQVEVDTSEDVRIYPNVLALKEFDLLNQRGRMREAGIRVARMRGLGTEFESLRDYAEGDDYRKIDWKASARKGHLVTRQYEQERNQPVILMIDVGRLMLAELNGVRKLDHVLDAVLMLTHAAAQAGDLIGALVFSDVVKRYIPPRKGRSQIAVIIEAIHDLIAEPFESDLFAASAYLSSRWKRRALIILFTDFEEEDRAREISAAFGPLSRRHLGLLVRVEDPALDSMLAKPIQTMRDMYEKTAASMLLADRRVASRVVSAAGIHSLEAEPQDLAAKLVTYYFKVKERALL